MWASPPNLKQSILPQEAMVITSQQQAFSLDQRRLHHQVTHHYKRAVPFILKNVELWPTIAADLQCTDKKYKLISID